MTATFVFSCIYFYLPGAAANVGAVIAKFIPIFKSITMPIDFGIALRGKRLIGDHKTIGNATFGILFGVSVGLIKYFGLDKIFSNYLFLDLTFLKSVFLFFLLSFGAVAGDLIKSVVKRQINISAHAPWIPFDEIDHTIASLLLVKIFFDISWSTIITTVAIMAILHFVSNLIGFRLKIKNVPY